ncbi:MAG: MFS transporter [Acidobacteriota bacterium]
MPGTQSIRPAPAGPRLRVVAHAGFLLIGIVNTLLGPILPMLTLKWQLGDDQAGQLFTAQFAGGMTGSAVSGFLVERLGFLPVIASGFAIMSVATGALVWISQGGGLVSFFCLGLALGLAIPATNLLVAELNPQRRAAALNILNLLWGTGAVAGPLLISGLGRGVSLARPMLALSGLLAAMMILATSCPNVLHSTTTADSSSPRLPLQTVWRSPFVLLTEMLVFLCVGTEAATGGWIASYADRLGEAGRALSTLTPSLFWAGLLAGRGLSPLLLGHLNEGSLLRHSLLMAVTGLGIVLFGQSVLATFVGTALAGLGLAPVFPTTFAVLVERCGVRTPQLTAATFLLASLGGAVIPWLVGFTSDRYGDLRIGLVVVLIGGLLMVALQIVISATRSDSEAPAC